MQISHPRVAFLLGRFPIYRQYITCQINPKGMRFKGYLGYRAGTVRPLGKLSAPQARIDPRVFRGLDHTAERAGTVTRTDATRQPDRTTDSLGTVGVGRGRARDSRPLESLSGRLCWSGVSAGLTLPAKMDTLRPPRLKRTSWVKAGIAGETDIKNISEMSEIS